MPRFGLAPLVQSFAPAEVPGSSSSTSKRLIIADTSLYTKVSGLLHAYFGNKNLNEIQAIRTASTTDQVLYIGNLPVEPRTLYITSNKGGYILTSKHIEGVRHSNEISFPHPKPLSTSRSQLCASIWHTSCKYTRKVGDDRQRGRIQT